MDILLWVIIYALISMNVLLLFVVARLSRGMDKNSDIINDIERQIATLSKL